jgi:hypothetical protein
MNTATTRSVIAAAGLAALGLVAWPHQAATPQAHGVPTVHRDVALVDTSTDILGPETTLDTTLFNDVLGSTGAEEQLYTGLSNSVGATEATALLDATGASPIYSGDFDGATSRLFEGGFLDTLAGEDQLNQLLGVTETASQTAILADLVDNPGPPIPDSTDITLADLTNAVGSSTFDTDLTTIANADYTLAGGDLTGWLDNLPTALSGLDSSDLLTSLLGDLGGSSGGDLLGSLGGDLGAILADLGGSL